MSLKKARNIRQRPVTDERSNISYLVVPNSNLAIRLSNALRSTGLVIVCDTGRRIGELVKHKINKQCNENSIVYKIPCNSCDSSYYGETHRGLEKRVREHRADVRYHRLTNALVNHIEDKGHLPKWEDAETVEKGISKQQRKVLEALHIATNDNINQRTGDIKWTTTTARYAARERIKKSCNYRGPPPHPPGRGSDDPS